MESAVLQSYLHEHIPLSAAMGVTVVSASEHSIELAAPLGPNINHRDTVFGGSASALAILAAWSLVHLRLDAAGRPCRIVIQHNAVDYTAPLAGDFSAVSELAEPDAWERFMRTLDRRGKARLVVRCTLASGGAVGGRFEGVFVAIDTAREQAGEAAPR